jgi:hypothetical protein
MDESRDNNQFPKFPDDEVCPKCRGEKMTPTYAPQIKPGVFTELMAWECDDCGFETVTLCADAKDTP